MDKIVSLSKRRGFIFQSSEIYGGLGSAWDYGPLGVELKNNVKRLWWRDNVQLRDDMAGLDAAITMHPRVWEASGHVASFSDPFTGCPNCGRHYRADHVEEARRNSKWWQSLKEAKDTGRWAEVERWAKSDKAGKKLAPNLAFVRNPDFGKIRAVGDNLTPVSGPTAYGMPNLASLPDEMFLDVVADSKLVCPNCGGKLSDPKPASLMLKIALGPVEETGTRTYLRPETAQGIFVNFDNVLQASRKKLPFGIAQIGKAFRNEITPGNFTFRTREFEQMEIEYFVKAGEDEAAHQAWIDARTRWYTDLGLRRENLRQREQDKGELAHYAKRCVDLEYRFPMGWSELEGIANRTDFDLKAHSRGPDNPDSVAELRYFDQEQKKHIIPYVIEPSAGADRATLAFLCDAYDESLVTEPPAEEVAKLREQVASFARSVDKRDPKTMEADTKRRLVEAAERIGAGLPGTLPELLGLVDDPDANRIEVWKKVRGVAEKLGEEHARTVLRLHPRLAPITVAVFPLKKNEPRLVEMARGIKRELQAAGLRAVYDDTGAIGKLYRRQDEIGTPFCITVDFKSLEDGTVTVRDRDTMGQERAARAELAINLRNKVG